MGPRWAWHYRALTHLRDRLLATEREHAAAATAAPEMTGVESADEAREELDRDVLWAELGAEKDRLLEIDAALHRIRNGTYGRCEATGKPIDPDRLRAIPWTRYCPAAAAAAEKDQRRRN
jgi:RNA polymerase-binding transcription factor DksA